MTTELDYFFSEPADHYGFLRTVADGDAGPGWEDLRGDAALAFAALEQPGADLLIDPAVADWRGPPGELRRAAAGLPADIGGLDVRAVISTIADLLEATADRYRKQALPQRREQVHRAIGYLDQSFKPAAQACLDFIADAFDLTLPPVVRCALLASGLRVGGVTNENLYGEPVCLVAVDVGANTLLMESILNEATHAGAWSPEWPPRGSGPITTLMLGVAERGLDGGELNQVWHVPFFITAAEAVRRYIDPAHVPYGEAKSYYQRCRQAADLVMPVWTARLAGELTGQAAVDRILAQLPHA
ncbi:MAG TPA: hypothetical protein VE990_07945 [Acidimicrobiales bacterium]|nr:hypothetical protein [Acidimicrobiales bacterium]